MAEKHINKIKVNQSLSQVEDSEFLLKSRKTEGK